MERKKDQHSKASEIKKENQDFPNVPASTEKPHTEEQMKKEITKLSKLHPDGKTDNTEQNSEN